MGNDKYIAIQLGVGWEKRRKLGNPANGQKNGKQEEKLEKAWGWISFGILNWQTNTD